MNFAPVPDDETVIINGAWLYSGKQIRRYGSGPAIAWASDVAVSPGLDWQLIAEESAATGPSSGALPWNRPGRPRGMWLTLTYAMPRECSMKAGEATSPARKNSKVTAWSGGRTSP